MNYLAPSRSKHSLDYIKIALAVMGIVSMWLIFFLRQSGPVETAPVQCHMSEAIPPADSKQIDLISF